MRLMSWNLNGIISCVQHNSFQALSPFTPDIVCCQEIRTKQQPQALHGYHHFWNPGQRDGYSGTLTMTRQFPLSTLYGLGDEELDCEGRVLINMKGHGSIIMASTVEGLQGYTFTKRPFPENMC